MTIYLAILAMMALIGVGYGLKQTLLTGNRVWQLGEKITYYGLLPILLVHEIASTRLSLASIEPLLVMLILPTALVMGLLVMIGQWQSMAGPIYSSVFQGSTRYNSYLLFSVLMMVLPDQGLIYFSLITLVMIPLTNIANVVALGYYCKQLDQNRPTGWLVLNKSLTNPLIIAIIVGFLLNNLGLKLPAVLHASLMVGGYLAMVISLLAVGAGLNIRHLAFDSKAVLFATTVKLIILPLLCLSLLPLVNMSQQAKIVVVIYSAMPCASNAYLLARQMQGDTRVMASIITSTTLVSGLTLPLMLWLMIILGEV